MSKDDFSNSSRKSFCRIKGLKENPFLDFCIIEFSDLSKNFKQSDFGKEFNSECESFYVYRVDIIVDLRKTEPPNPIICKNAPLSKFKLRASSLDAGKRSIFAYDRVRGLVCLSQSYSLGFLLFVFFQGIQSFFRQRIQHDDVKDCHQSNSDISQIPYNCIRSKSTNKKHC